MFHKHSDGCFKYQKARKSSKTAKTPLRSSRSSTEEVNAGLANAKMKAHFPIVGARCCGLAVRLCQFHCRGNREVWGFVIAVPRKTRALIPSLTLSFTFLIVGSLFFIVDMKIHPFLTDPDPLAILRDVAATSFTLGKNTVMSFGSLSMISYMGNN